MSLQLIQQQAKNICFELDQVPCLNAQLNDEVDIDSEDDDYMSTDSFELNQTRLGDVPQAHLEDIPCYFNEDLQALCGLYDLWWVGERNIQAKTMITRLTAYFTVPDINILCRENPYPNKSGNAWRYDLKEFLKWKSEQPNPIADIQEIYIFLKPKYDNIYESWRTWHPTTRDYLQQGGFGNPRNNFDNKLIYYRNVSPGKWKYLRSKERKQLVRGH